MYLRLRKSALFDANYYLEKYPDVKKAGVNPLWHYIRIGWKEGRDPSSKFSTSDYLKANQDVAQAGMNPLWHYLNYGVWEKRPLYTSDMFAVDNARRELREYHFKKAFDYLAEKKLHNLQYVFLFPLFSTGGAELVGMNFIKYILQKKPNAGILVIITDLNNCLVPSDLPDNVVFLNLLGDLVIDDWEDRKSLVFHLVNATKPDVLHIINSSIGWQVLLEQYEIFRDEIKVYANIFCNQINEDGSRVGYADLYGEKGIPLLSGLISDNQYFFLETQDKLGSFPERLHTVYNYHAPSKLPRRMMNLIKQSKKLKCLWVGRLDWQKNYPLLFEIASISDFAEFDVYGNPVMGSMPQFPELENLKYNGGFTSLDDIPNLHEYDCLVFTTRYEGLPNVLLEIGDLGIPIIAPAIGGIPELINSETGFLLSSAPSADDYREALLDIREHPEKAKSRAEKLRKLITERHGWEAFTASIDRIPGYIK